MPQSVDAILMASGLSARFGGEDKLLQPFRGRPLAAHTLALAAGLHVFGRIFLVCASPGTAALAQGLPVQVVHNPNPQHGQGESIRLGTAASRAAHYLFFTCDQPLLDAATVHTVLAQAETGRIVVPAHGGRPGNPALFSAAFREELLALQPGESARIIKQRHPHAVLEVDVPSPWPLFDVDTPGDLARLEREAPHAEMPAR